MSPTLALAVAVTAGNDAIERALPHGGPLRVASVLRIDPSAFDRADPALLDAIVVICGTPDDTVLDFVRTALRARPWLPLVVACRPGDGAALRELIAAGADDIVPLLDDEDDGGACSARLLFAIEKARAVRAGAGEQAARPGEIITIVGPKGGTVRTLTTCNAAVALAQAGRRVVVVDLDLQFGDVGLAMAISPDRTIYDLAMAGSSIDTEMLGEYLVEHSSGVRVLVAPVRPDQAGAITTDLVRDVLATLQRMCDVVIVDTPPGFTPEVIASVDASTALWIVAGMDSLSLKNTRLALDTLDLMGCSADTMRLILNRADTRVGVNSSDVEALLGRAPEVLVPSHRDIVRAVNEGQPIVLGDPSCEASQAFFRLAATCLPGEHPATASPKAARPRRRRGLRRATARPAVGV